MFRRLISGLASAFPTKATSDRIIPYATLLVAIIAAASALFQYGNSLAIARVTATMELHKQFLSETFQKARQEFGTINQKISEIAFRARCEFIRDAASNKILTLPQGAILDCQGLNDATRLTLESINLASDQRAKLRQLALAKVRQLSMSSDGIAQLDIFYRSIVTCVSENVCSGETAAALFAREMVTFVNATCAFDSVAGPGRTTNDEIARFLVRLDVNKNIYWNRDPGREQLFACERQRAFEN